MFDCCLLARRVCLCLILCSPKVLQLTPQYAQIVNHNVYLLIYTYIHMVVVFRTDTNNIAESLCHLLEKTKPELKVTLTTPDYLPLIGGCLIIYI